MNDLIRREDATETFVELYDIFDDYPNIVKELHKVYDKILTIPSAEKQGEWISLHNGKWKCSECGIEVLIYAKGNFCPNCGAKMKK